MKKLWKFFNDYTSLVVVAISYFLVMIYVVVAIVLSYKGISLQDTLTEWVFKFFGLELIAISGIKISKHIGSAFGKIEEDISDTEAFNGEDGE